MNTKTQAIIMTIGRLLMFIFAVYGLYEFTEKMLLLVKP